MGELTAKTKSAVNIAVGSIRAAAGRATGNHSMILKGNAQRRKGRDQRFSAAINGAISNKL